MKVKFNTSVVFHDPSLSFSMNQVVEIDEKLVAPYLANGVAEEVKEAVEAKEAPKKAKATASKKAE
jgi:hypothetical protein